jgi:hypothetical protein
MFLSTREPAIGPECEWQFSVLKTLLIWLFSGRPFTQLVHPPSQHPLGNQFAKWNLKTIQVTIFWDEMLCTHEQNLGGHMWHSSFE